MEDSEWKAFMALPDLPQQLLLLCHELHQGASSLQGLSIPPTEGRASFPADVGWDGQVCKKGIEV